MAVIELVDQLGVILSHITANGAVKHSTILPADTHRFAEGAEHRFYLLRLGSQKIPRDEKIAARHLDAEFFRAGKNIELHAALLDAIDIAPGRHHRVRFAAEHHVDALEGRRSSRRQQSYVFFRIESELGEQSSDDEIVADAEAADANGFAF